RFLGARSLDVLDDPLMDWVVGAGRLDDRDVVRLKSANIGACADGRSRFLLDNLSTERRVMQLLISARDLGVERRLFPHPIEELQKTVRFDLAHLFERLIGAETVAKFG